MANYYEMMYILRPDLSEEQVVEYLRERLAGYKIPRHVRFVDALPMSAQGKVQKAEIKKQFAGETGNG